MKQLLERRRNQVIKKRCPLPIPQTFAQQPGKHAWVSALCSLLGVYFHEDAQKVLRSCCMCAVVLMVPGARSPALAGAIAGTLAASTQTQVGYNSAGSVWDLLMGQGNGLLPSGGVHWLRICITK